MTKEERLMQPVSRLQIMQSEVRVGDQIGKDV